MAESPDLGLAHCLEQLSDAVFLNFKELLKKKAQLQGKLNSWTNTETTSRNDLIMLLNTHYSGQVWNIMSYMFLRINRRDLWTKVQELRRDKRMAYKEIMKITFGYIWTWETFIHIPDESYQEIVKIQYKALQEVFDPQLKPVTAVILGSESIGKTTFLRKAMLDWAAGDLWKNRFQYVFFFSLVSLNSTTELSLAQLLLSQLSASSETLDDVLSDPRKILFILDGFDHLKFDLELRTDLCNDWRKTLPTQIVLSSLLQKVMLPESSLLLELGNPSIPKIYPLLQYPREITIGGLSEESRRFYCVCFFNDVDKGSEVFDYLQSMQALLTLCVSPYICWMFCSTVKWQCDRGEEMNFFCPSDSSMYTKFMVSSFRSVYDNCPAKQNRARLKTLCTLAAEGMWKRVFVFKSEDLRRNGISESEQTSWLKMNFLLYQGDCFMFYHPLLQSYFAALFYYLRRDKETPHPIIGSLPQFLREVYAHGQTQWLRTGMFVFGIAAEEVTAMLNPHFGLMPSREMREVIFKCLRSLSQGERSKTLSDQSLIDSLIDIQQEKFETQVMDLFEELTVDISDANKMTLVEYSLLKSLKLKKLHMHIQQRVFSEIYNPEDGGVEDFRQHEKTANKYWSSLCGIFWNLQVLDLDSCNFNETAIQHLCKSLSPAPRIPLNMFKLQSLSCSFMTNFGDGTLFHTVLQLPRLTSLNLYGTNLSDDAVEKICSRLKSGACRLEELLLGKCGISSKACSLIATSIKLCKLKHLSLVENPLENKGAMELCEILRHPSCMLEKLMLSYCSLTFIVCGHLNEALSCNKHLSLLDLGSNFLEDVGANILCEALKDPNCPLQELWLSGCCLTSDCCEKISTVLTCNTNLKTLKLGNNNIQDMGVKRLCEALRNPACKLQCLGLDMCALTTACCADLASALSTCRTLTRLSLDWVTLDHHGVELLCEALTCRGCNVKVLGLDKSALSEESQKLLQDVEKKNNLNILHYPWVKEENKMRGVRLVWNSKN